MCIWDSLPFSREACGLICELGDTICSLGIGMNLVGVERERARKREHVIGARTRYVMLCSIA